MIPKKTENPEIQYNPENFHPCKCFTFLSWWLVIGENDKKYNNLNQELTFNSVYTCSIDLKTQSLKTKVIFMYTYGCSSEY